MRSSRGVGGGHAGVGVLFDCQGNGPALLHGVAQAVKGTHAGVAAHEKTSLDAQPAPIS